MTDQLKTLYKDTIVPKLMDQFNYQNIHQVPMVVKVTVNRGLQNSSGDAGRGDGNPAV